jgi:hypothetical protein
MAIADVFCLIQGQLNGITNRANFLEKIIPFCRQIRRRTMISSTA